MQRVLCLAAFALLGITVSIAFSQPPGGRGPEGNGPGGRGTGFGPPPNPVLEALDADGDHEISAEELQAAVVSLKKLDKNGDGKLTHDELHPEMPGGRPGGDHRGGPQGTGPAQGPHAGPAEGSGMHGPGGPGPGGPNAGRGPGGPPSPQQYVEQALQFDSDQDGKLSKVELLKFAEHFIRSQHAGGRPGEHGGRTGSQQPTRPQRPAIE